ncbi:MAG: hypothetical protein Q9196_000879, partial [Gyalolechia fulgens]
MRLNGATELEIENLEKLTAAGCSVTPTLLAVKIDVQDESILRYPAWDQREDDGDFSEGGTKWWMPGGYIVYILMGKLPAQSLDTFWKRDMFTKHDRDEVRNAFKKAYLEVTKLGFFHYDSKLENLMWDKSNQK